MADDSVLHPGSPRGSIDQDALGRARFVENLAQAVRSYTKSDSLTIGLYGPWGCGKSSLLNFVIEELGKDSETIAVARFNPWNFSQQERVFSTFFATLSALIRRADKSARAKKAAAWLDALSAVTAPASLFGLGFISDGAKQLSAAAKDFAKQFGDIENTKAEISAILEKSEKRYVIIVDDIDRLTESEIRQVFQLVKSVADFKNVVYILAFDRRMVSMALDGVTNSQGDLYLERIINVPINVPPLTARQAQRLLKADLDGFQQRQRAYDWENERLDGIKTLAIRVVETVRHIERISNALAIVEGLTKDDIDFTDLIGLTVLKALEPALYDFVAGHPDLFVDDFSNMLFRADGQDKIDRDVIEGQLTKLQPMKRDDALTLLSALFPKVNRIFDLHTRHYGDERDWRREFRACADYRTFFRYFALQVDEADISAADRIALHAAADSIDAFEEFLQGLNSQERIFFALQYLGDVRADEFTIEQISNIVTAIFDIGDELQSAFEGPFEKGTTACAALLRNLPLPDRATPLLTALKHPAASLEMPVTACTRIASPKVAILSSDQASEVLAELASLLESAWADGRLIEHPRALYLMYQWLHISEQKAKATIYAALEHDDLLFLQYLGLFEHVQATSYIPDRFHVAGVLRVFTLDDLKSRLEQLAVEPALSAESGRIAELLAETVKFEQAGQGDPGPEVVDVDDDPDPELPIIEA